MSDEQVDRLVESWEYHQGDLRAERNARLVATANSRRERHRSEWDTGCDSPAHEDAIRALEDFRGGDESGSCGCDDCSD